MVLDLYADSLIPAGKIQRTDAVQSIKFQGSRIRANDVDLIVRFLGILMFQAFGISHFWRAVAPVHLTFEQGTVLQKDDRESPYRIVVCEGKAEFLRRFLGLRLDGLWGFRKIFLLAGSDREYCQE